MKKPLVPVASPFPRSCLALAVALSTHAAAQGPGALEEIIVTAEHREAGLQETQISISALSRETLQDLGISNGTDLLNSVPNLNAQPYVGGRTGIGFNIRGIGNSETLISFDPAVSVYLNGILIAKNTGALLDVLDLERIEVLRGPQGTLYGRNTMGGAVNYITQKPSNEFEARLGGTFGNYGRADLRGMLNLPLMGADSAAGELNLRLNAARLNRDGFQDNVFELAPQDELGTVDRWVYAMQLEWRPTDSFSALYMYDYTDIDEIPEAPWTTNTNPDTFFGTVLAPFGVTDESNRPNNIQLEHPGIAETKVKGHSLTLNWSLSDNMTLVSLTGYRDMDNYGEADSDGAPVGATFPNPPIPPAIVTRDLQEYDSISQEFRLLGNAFDAKMDYVMGVFYMDEEGDLSNETIAAGNSSTNIASYTNEAWAVFGQGTWHFSEALDLTLGARYTEEDREMEKAFIVGTSFVPPIFFDDVKRDPALADTIFPTAQDDFDNVTWLVSLGYNWSEDVMTYAKVSTGYQSGGFNARDQDPRDFTTGFQEEKLVAYEIGLKSTFDGRYQVNGAIFFSDYDDKRVNQFNPETLVSVQRNAGVVEIWGIELEMLAQLTENWRVGLNYGHVDPEYVEYESDGVDLSDMANFPYTPENTASANVIYERPLDIGLFRARLDWSFRDEMTFLVPVPERNSGDSVQLWNARVSLQDIKVFGDSALRVSAWGKNLTDEGYYNFGVNIYSSFGFDINTYGEPRTYGVDLELMF